MRSSQKCDIKIKAASDDLTRSCSANGKNSTVFLFAKSSGRKMSTCVKYIIPVTQPQEVKNVQISFRHLCGGGTSFQEVLPLNFTEYEEENTHRGATAHPKYCALPRAFFINSLFFESERGARGKRETFAAGG